MVHSVHQRYCRNTQMENFLQRKISHIHNNPDGSQRQTHGEPLDEHVAASGGVDAFHTERTGCPTVWADGRVGTQHL